MTSGAFGRVRNPLFTAMAVTGLGRAVRTPSLVALTGLATLLVAFALQVRVVEEPYPRLVHGAEYDDYPARTGRFLPGVGCSPAPAAPVRCPPPGAAV